MSFRVECLPNSLQHVGSILQVIKEGTLLAGAVAVYLCHVPVEINGG